MKRKNRSLHILIFSFIALSLLASCAENDSNKFIISKVEDTLRPNFIRIQLIDSTLVNATNQWTLPSGETIKNQDMITAYFSKKGDYIVKLKINKGTKTSELCKQITILKDDSCTTSGETLVWHDEFDAHSLNSNNWKNETDVHVNNELQTYTDGKNISFEDGKLIITACKVGDSTKRGDYTSARIISEGKKEFTFGRMEIRALIPNGRGTWPAIWMLGKAATTLGWPKCGEIDIMEHVGFDPTKIHGSLHSPSSFGGTVNTGTTILRTYDTEYHIYGLNWTPDKIEFYIDNPNNIFYTYHPLIKNSDTWPFDKPFYFILNLAVGGDWGGSQGVDNTIFPKSMYIDYVRVFQKK